MDRAPFWVMLTFFLLFSMTNSKEQDAKMALVEFMAKLSPGNAKGDANWGWNASSDPCTDKWKGVACDTNQQSVKKIVLDRQNLTGVLDADSLCETTNLLVLSLNDNNVVGDLPEEISNCKYLTHLYLSGNGFSGKLPDSLSKLSNLKRVDLSSNGFSDELPNLSRISGLLTFLAQNNQLSGSIPEFNFANLEEFNISNNNLSGPIPNVEGYFNTTSFLGNPALCGKPLSNSCPPPVKKSKHSKRNQYLIYSGYTILALVVLTLIAVVLIKKSKPKEKNKNVAMKMVKVDNNYSKSSSGASIESKTGGTRSEYSITSVESGVVSSSLVVLSSTPVVNGLRFEDLLRAPAELIARGKRGSLYKVIPEGGATFVVKRIKDWEISKEDFKKRMQRINQAKHPNVLPVIAYYCSNQEKLLVYEYQQNDSLFKLLHGSQNGQLFDWGSRLNIAASTAEGLVFMHEELRSDGIAHGNLKTSNILLNNDMDPCISEYGLMEVENQDLSFINEDPSGGDAYSTFKEDVYGFGVILLELLTGKLVHNSGFDLAKWVHSVVKEEWTSEVFDKSLISEGASEERMVNLLQVALKCINHSADARPNISEVAVMINTIKQEEERSTSS